MSTVITVENLGKKYTLRHQSGQQPYVALRDVIAERAAAIGRKLLHPFHSSLLTPHSSQEDFWALKDVSFEVKQGDRIGIIGRNGAGKSTLLKILSRITEPTTGSVRIKGRVASLLEVGTGFHPELTGRENIYLNGAILGMHRAEIKKKFDEIVDFAEIEKFLDTPVKRYSSGMYVRLAFAVAAHLEPEILVVDEVLAVGDVQFQKKCLGKMEDVSSQDGRIILFVSHNLTAVKAMCNRAIMLQQGNLMDYRAAYDVVDRYLGQLQENVLVREWPDPKSAPHTSSIRLLQVRICAEDGTPAEQVYSDEAFLVAVEYNVEKEGAFVGMTLLVHDAENNCVFSSINNLENEWYGKAMPAGSYVTHCLVPPDFFNCGWYSMSFILFGKGFSDAQTVQDLLRLEVLDGASLRGDYFGAYGGVVRPRLTWRTSKACQERMI